LASSDQLGAHFQSLAATGSQHIEVRVDDPLLDKARKYSLSMDTPWFTRARAQATDESS
jgi:hypothetical protein